MDFAEGPPPVALARLFGGEPFRFSFNLRPGSYGWFEPSTASRARLAERRGALESTVAPGLVWSGAMHESWHAFAEWAPPEMQVVRGGNPRDAAAGLAGRWAPDFLLLTRSDPEADFRFCGGAVCFPTAWDPMEKVGRTLPEIHAPVPTLNGELGPRIRRFLNGLRAGEVFERENWGLAATPELRLHPALARPRLGVTGGLEGVWFRLEEQAFVKMPGAEVLLFLIHVRVWPLVEVAAVPGVAAGLARALRTMPGPVAAYKGLTEMRPGLIAALESGG